MRQKIYYGSDDYSGLWFWILLICLVCCCFWWWTPDYSYGYNDAAYTSSGWSWSVWGWIILGILFIWWIFALIFSPLYVEADDNEVRIRRPLKTKSIRMDEIESVEPYQVSKKASGKLFGSSPVKVFGKWGKYRDDKIGDYFAYYGKPDNTVLITLKDGRKYVVGATDAKALSDYINSKKS